MVCSTRPAITGKPLSCRSQKITPSAAARSRDFRWRLFASRSKRLDHFGICLSAWRQNLAPSFKWKWIPKNVTSTFDSVQVLPFSLGFHRNVELPKDCVCDEDQLLSKLPSSCHDQDVVIPYHEESYNPPSRLVVSTKCFRISLGLSRSRRSIVAFCATRGSTRIPWANL